MQSEKRVLAIFAIATSFVVGSISFAQAPPTPPFQSLPDRGAVPHIVAMPSDAQSIAAAPSERAVEWRGVIESLKRRAFRRGRSQAQRAEGLIELREITDTAAFQSMIELLEDEDDDVRRALLEHFESVDIGGQAALAWMAIYTEDEALRYEATLRIHTPATQSVLAILDHALRDTRHAIVSNAASLANALNAIETIPLLIFNQATSDEFEKKGDLAWIAVGTQVSYVQDLIPVAGSGSGAFNPVVGTILEGTVLAIGDAFVTVYRTEVHYALHRMASRDWGESTEHLGWNMPKWAEWYNDEYIPFKREQQIASGSSQGVEALLDGLE